MNEESKKRLKKLMTICAIALGGGVLYLIIIRIIGRGIPCLIRLSTGTYCPGCGISRMFVALSRFDVRAAFEYNPLAFCLLPFAAVFGVRYSVSYVMKGRTEFDKAEKVFLIISGALTLAFWVLRNLPQFSYLAPIAT